MSTRIGAENLAVLRHAAFETPTARPAGNLDAFLATRFANFFDQLAHLRGSLAERMAARAYWMRELASSLEAVVSCTRQRRHERACQLMEEVLDEHLGTLKRVSLRHAYTVIGSQSWYRLTTWREARRRRDVFHLPFQMKAASYRFSAPGRPALYLGNSVYVCWLECQGPPLESSRVARFEVDVRDGEYFLDLPANHATYLAPLSVVAGLGAVDEIHPGRITNSPYLDDVEDELADYLSLWPLLMASTVQKREPAPVDPAEYVVPQLLMQWTLKQRGALGVRYFTSKFDKASNSNDLSINVVLPTRTTGKNEGFCDVLADRVRCTLPQSLDDIMRVDDETLFTDEAADARQARSGRYMVNWEGSWRHYRDTPFGRMEYWLDRPQQAVDRIEAA